MLVADVAMALIMAQMQSDSISEAHRAHHDARLKKAAAIMMHFASAGTPRTLVRLAERPEWMIDPQGRLILAFHS